MRGEKTIHKRSLLRGREGLRFAVLIVLALVLVIVNFAVVMQADIVCR